MALREFTDQQGRNWQVWATYPGSRGERVRQDLADGWLTFISGKERRRLIRVPKEWDSASEDDLRAWLGRALDASPFTRLL